MKSDGEHRWLVPYADLTTLLFALFAMLYALSMQPDSVKQQHSAVLDQLFSNQQQSPKDTDTVFVDEKQRLITLAGTSLFATPSATQISQQGAKQLQQLASDMAGHTDEVIVRCYVGANQGGVANAARLCGIVGEQLINRSVSAQRLQLISMGERIPIASNQSATSALVNFRITIETKLDDR